MRPSRLKDSVPHKYIAKDKALVRRFDVVNIKEPNIEMVKNIMYKIKDKYKKHHNIIITKNNLVIKFFTKKRITILN